MRNEVVRIQTRSYYDMQALRIQTGNRICASFRTKLGLTTSNTEEIDEVEDVSLGASEIIAEKLDADELLNDIRKEFKLMTDGVKRLTSALKTESPLITNQCELTLIDAYEKLLKSENEHKKAIQIELEKEKIWTEYLVNIRGVGPLMAAVIVSEIDIHKCNSIAALHKYVGIDVVLVEKEDGIIVGEGRCKKPNHLEEKIYHSKKTKEKIVTKGITYNPFLKTKMVGVLGGVFIKMGGPYKEIYNGNKYRLQNTPEHKDKTKRHIHNMANRYMISEFLADLYSVWRTIEGLPVAPKYAEAKLGIIHSKPCRVKEWIDDWNRKQNAA